MASCYTWSVGENALLSHIYGANHDSTPSHHHSILGKMEEMLVGTWQPDDPGLASRTSWEIFWFVVQLILSHIDLCQLNQQPENCLETLVAAWREGNLVFCTASAVLLRRKEGPEHED